MNTSPGGDAMTARFHRDAEAAALKRQKLCRPIAWTLHPVDAAWFAARGQHCQTRRCRELVAVVTWRWWRSAEAGRVLQAEHFVCTEHGQEFADRHGTEIEPPPDEPSHPRGAPGKGDPR
jgi:hypothetical protein